MELPEIIISCQGATTVALEELQDLQGNLKDLSESNYVKLRNSILEYGFSFPIFIWIDENGTKWVLDAHQRKRTLSKMKEEGYVIPPLPADIIQAKDKIDAKKKLLLLNSRYGKIQLEGYEEFIHEDGAQIIESDIADVMEIPDLQLWAGVKETDESQPPADTTNPEKVREITCPACQHKFTLFGNEN